MACNEKHTWWKEGVVYQIYPRSFQDSNGDGFGDLKGITSRLEYVKKLGADIIWLNPVYKSPQDDNGYDISDYRDIEPALGTMADFDELLGKAHSLGLRVVMDLVVNHTSDEHAWFIESRKRNGKYKDYYIWRDEKNNWGGCFGGSAWQWDEERGQYYLHLFSKKQPDLNWENPEVREDVFDMMRFWGDKGIDGFRMDVISMISKVQTFPDGPVYGGEYGDSSPYVCNGPRVHEFLREMNRKVISRYDWLTVGEAPGSGVEDALSYTGYDQEQLQMVFSFDHMDHAKGSQGNLFRHEPFSLAKYKEILSKWQYGLEGRGWNSLYLENHDQTRSVSRYGNTSTPELWKKSAKMLAVTYMLMKGTAYVFEGQELGMTNYPFRHVSELRDIQAKGDWDLLHKLEGMSEEEAMPLIAEFTRDNSRTPMQWDKSKYAGFSASEPWIAVNSNHSHINVEEEEKDEDSILHFYRRLIHVKKGSETLIYGKYELLLPDDPDLFVYTRTLGGERYTIIANWSANERALPLDAKGETVISNYDESAEKLRPYEALVLKEEADA